MDKEQIIKELVEPYLMRKVVFDCIRRLIEDYQRKKDSGQIEEFVEFVLLRDYIKSVFGLENPSEQRVVDFGLTFLLVLIDVMTENNRRWLQVLSVEE
jgi:hypothetical protein